MFPRSATARTSTGRINLVTVQIAGYPFDSLVPAFFPDVAFGPISHDDAAGAMTSLPTMASRRPRSHSGAAIVEFALVALVFFGVLIGILEFGRMLFYWNSVTEATRLGARIAVVCDIGEANIKTRMQEISPYVPAGNINVAYAPSGCGVRELRIRDRERRSGRPLRPDDPPRAAVDHPARILDHASPREPRQLGRQPNLQGSRERHLPLPRSWRAADRLEDRRCRAAARSARPRCRCAARGGPRRARWSSPTATSRGCRWSLRGPTPIS